MPCASCVAYSGFFRSRPLSEPLKPLKAIILEPLKCLSRPLSDFIFTFEPLFSAFCPKNAHYLGFESAFLPGKGFLCLWRAVRGKSHRCQHGAIYSRLSNTPCHRMVIGINQRF